MPKDYLDEKEVEMYKKIVKEVRETVELAKKGKPEGIWGEEVTARALKHLNDLRVLLDDSKLHWSKDGDGRPILVSE